MMFDATLLRSFQAVAQEASFTRAADRLGLTQSAVSGHVRRLEEQAGRPLFVRNTRSVALTPDGETLLGYARAILQLNEEAKRKLSGAMSKGARIRLGASDDFMSSWLPSVLQAFQAARPGVVIETAVANTRLLLASLDRGELDVVVGSRCHGDQTGHLLWREPLVWAYAKAGQPEPATPLPLALFPDPCPYRDAALAALAAAGRDWRIAVISPSVGSLRAAAAAALAVAPINRSLLTRELRALGPDTRLPALPDVEFMVFSRRHQGGAEIAAITEEIARVARGF
jgi:DNA-binding transcriptional LysR family regulator